MGESNESIRGNSYNISVSSHHLPGLSETEKLFHDITNSSNVKDQTECWALDNQSEMTSLCENDVIDSLFHVELDVNFNVGLDVNEPTFFRKKKKDISFSSFFLRIEKPRRSDPRSCC